MRLASIGKGIVAGALRGGLVLALAACGGVATEVPATAEPAPAATERPAIAERPALPSKPTSAPKPTEAPELPTTAPVLLPTPANSAAQWVPVDPCALLDATSVGVMYGGLVGSPTASDAMASGGQACTFETSKVTLRIEVYNGNETPAEKLLAELEGQGFPMEPEMSSADEAFAGQTADRAALLMVQDATVLLFALTNKSDELNRAATLLNGMAATALMNLPEPTAASEEPAAPSTSSTSGAPTEGPCALLTGAEVEAAFGALDGAPDDSGRDGDGNPSCAYVTRDAMLFLSSSTGSAAVEAQVARAKESGASLEAVTGLGDEAYVAAASMDAPGGAMTQGVILVRKGDTLLQIATMSALGEGETADALQQLAGQALARLP